MGASLPRYGNLDVENGQCDKLLKTVPIVRIEYVVEVFEPSGYSTLDKNSKDNRGAGLGELPGESMSTQEKNSTGKHCSRNESMGTHQGKLHQKPINYSEPRM